MYFKLKQVLEKNKGLKEYGKLYLDETQNGKNSEKQGLDYNRI